MVPSPAMTRSCRRRAPLALAALAALAAAPAAADDWAAPDFAYAALVDEPPGVDVPLARPAAPAPAANALPAAAAAPPPEEPDLGERIVAAAQHLLGRPFRGDCSGFVLSLLREAGVRPALPPARSRSESLFRGGEPVAAPRPGHLAFFHDTYDRNRDGRRNDRFTHVALVEKVEGELVTLLHRGLHGIERLRMDLARPRDPSANDRVRIPRKADPPGTPLLAGELFAGFGAVAR